MIPKVSAKTVDTVILQEGRDVLSYIKESIELLGERQPVLKEVLFNDIRGVMERHKAGKDDLDTVEFKILGIISLVIRCIYAQDEANELSEQWEI